VDAKISYSAIRAAFDGDDDIRDYCDEDNSDKTPEGVADDVYEKLLDYEELVDGVFKTLMVNEEEVGFVYYFGDVLVSFGVNKAYRDRDFLTSLFEDMKRWMGGEFITFMWKRNERAIKWFEKCGMKKEDFELDNVIKLRYKPCQ